MPLRLVWYVFHPILPFCSSLAAVGTDKIRHGSQSGPRRDCCEFPPRQRPVCPASVFFQCPSARCASARACLQPPWSPARSAARARAMAAATVCTACGDTELQFQLLLPLRAEELGTNEASPLVARLGLAEMSAIRSLSGAKRTLRKPRSDKLD
jgi:hypothetical protein